MTWRKSSRSAVTRVATTQKTVLTSDLMWFLYSKEGGPIIHADIVWRSRNRTCGSTCGLGTPEPDPDQPVTVDSSKTIFFMHSYEADLRAAQSTGCIERGEVIYSTRFLTASKAWIRAGGTQTWLFQGRVPRLIFVSPPARNPHTAPKIGFGWNICLRRSVTRGQCERHELQSKDLDLTASQLQSLIDLCLWLTLVKQCQAMQV